MRGWVGSDSKKFGSGPKMIFRAKFSLRQFYVAKQDQRVELSPGKFWENIIKVSLNEDKNSRIFTH